jgi:hypothetical protein
VKKKKSNVPVFLIYAGIIHALGLALLLPMLITLPGPATSVAPQAAAIDVEIVPAASLAAKIESDSEQTSALPPAEPDAAMEPQPEGAAVANVSPDAQAAVEEEPVEAEPAAADKAAPKAAAPAKAAPRAAKKPVVQRSRAKPAVKRAAKTNTKIAPFNGALSGLFSPGAPANNNWRR